MPQTFPPYANMLARASLLGAVLLLAGGGWVLGATIRSPYATREGVPIAQPVPFSHEHHVAGLGIDCRYCHTSVETTASAGYPPTRTCMGCHTYVWGDSPMLEPVRESWRLRKPIAWTRVYDLPDYVFFNHSIHVAKGVGCETCHGRIDRMPVVYKTNPLSMKWCLDCHREPERYLRPREEVFTMGYRPPRAQEELGRELKAAYGIRQGLTECYTCHR